MSTSPGTWRRRSRSSSRLGLTALFAVGCVCAAPAVGARGGQTDLAFTRVVGDTSTVWIADADGSHARRVAYGVGPRLSADGKWLSYLRIARPRGLYVILTEGSRAKRFVTVYTHGRREEHTLRSRPRRRSSSSSRDRGRDRRWSALGTSPSRRSLRMGVPSPTSARPSTGRTYAATSSRCDFRTRTSGG
jgi:hypothetical protein